MTDRERGAPRPPPGLLPARAVWHGGYLCVNVRYLCTYRGVCYRPSPPREVPAAGEEAWVKVMATSMHSKYRMLSEKTTKDSLVLHVSTTPEVDVFVFETNTI